MWNHPALQSYSNIYANKEGKLQTVFTDRCKAVSAPIYEALDDGHIAGYM
jgi:hypothetical protein